jgi:hypothetical protein
VIVTVPAPVRISGGVEEKATCPACDATNVVHVQGRVEQSLFAATLGVTREHVGAYPVLRQRAS